MDNDLKEAHEYLAGGGLGELHVFASHCATLNKDKVLIDTVAVLALIELANDGLAVRAAANAVKH